MAVQTRLAKLRFPLYTSRPLSTPASCLQGLNDQSASPIVIHISRGCSEPLEYCPSTFLPPSAACVLDTLTPAYPGCRVVRLEEPHSGVWNHYLFFSNCRGKRLLFQRTQILLDTQLYGA